MNQQIISTIIELLVLIIATVIGRYVIPFVKIKVDADKLSLISAWALTFVKAAENMILGEKTGDEKRELVMQWLTEKADEIGIVLTQAQIRALLEEAVRVIHMEEAAVIRND